MTTRFRILMALGLCGGLMACSESPKSGPSNKAPSTSSSHTAHAAGAAASVMAPPGAKVFFEQPVNGAEVVGPLVEGKVAVLVKMGVSGIEVRPAGEQIKGTGHHHIIINGAGLPLGDVVPKDDSHLHFGLGQTEAEVQLSPGPHTLSLQFADGAHLSYGPQLASSIKIQVKAAP